MAEYIEREAFREYWNKNWRHLYANDKFLIALENFPAADVVPRAEVEDRELTIQGIMWSVDKWLDEADYDPNPIKRAITMREKTLQIVENLRAEVAREISAKIMTSHTPDIDGFFTIHISELTELQNNHAGGSE